MNNKQLSEYHYGKDAPLRCPKCEAVWPEGSKFCGYCGTRLIKIKDTAKDTDTP